MYVYVCVCVCVYVCVCVCVDVNDLIPGVIYLFIYLFINSMALVSIYGRV